ELVGMVAPFHAGRHRAQREEAVVVDAEAVHFEQRHAGRVAADRGPDREPQCQMFWDGNIFDTGAELFESLRRRAYLGVNVGLRVAVTETLLENADAQALGAAVERLGVFRD